MAKKKEENPLMGYGWNFEITIWSLERTMSHPRTVTVENSQEGMSRG